MMTLLTALLRIPEFSALSLGFIVTIIVLVIEWNKILNHMRVERVSLSVIEYRGLRLPRKLEIVGTCACTLMLGVLLVQFIVMA